MLNNISNDEIKRFTPDKLLPCVYQYRHSDDCRREGCPGHTAVFSYESVTDIFRLDFGEGTYLLLDSQQMDMVHDWILRLKI